MAPEHNSKAAASRLTLIWNSSERVIAMSDLRESMLGAAPRAPKRPFGPFGSLPFLPAKQSGLARRTAALQSESGSGSGRRLSMKTMLRRALFTIPALALAATRAVARQSGPAPSALGRRPAGRPRQGRDGPRLRPVPRSQARRVRPPDQRRLGRSDRGHDEARRPALGRRTSRSCSTTCRRTSPARPRGRST